MIHRRLIACDFDRPRRLRAHAASTARIAAPGRKTLERQAITRA
jgi:hypothetical protein